MAKEIVHVIVSANNSKATMSKSNGKQMKIRVGSRVVFKHVAMGLKPMIGVVIEQSETLGFIVKADKKSRIYPGVFVDNPKGSGSIIKRIKY